MSLSTAPTLICLLSTEFYLKRSSWLSKYNKLFMIICGSFIDSEINDCSAYDAEWCRRCVGGIKKNTADSEKSAVMVIKLVGCT